MNHMLTENSGGYKKTKHWRDSENIPHNSKAPKPKAKNEQKSPLFIFMKQIIDKMNPDNTTRIERYVENYVKLPSVSEADKSELRKMFQDKLASI